MFRRAVAVLTAAAALTSACGDDDTAVGSAVTAAPTSSHSTAADQGGAPAGTPEPGAAPDALRFTAPLVGGGDIDLTGHAGQPVLLWFWAPY